MIGGLRARTQVALPYLCHLPLALWFFGSSLFRDRLPFFRDIAVYYYPNYVFLERSLAQGVWPLWNPWSDAGAPFLVVYPLDLVSVLLAGAEGALRLEAPLHAFLAMAGATWLARRLGLGPAAAWAAGAFYGASGFVQSAANLFELFHATAWAPWVVGAVLAVAEQPVAWRGAVLGLLAALQVSTLGAETVLQTGAASALLMRGWPSRRAWVMLAAAALVALLLAAPALLGVRALVEGTQRAQGFSPNVSFSWSAHPAVLLEVLLPRFFGDTHTFTDRGFSGQPFFTNRYPYMLSLYLGVPLALLCLRAGPERRRRLWALALLGTGVALGSYGPLQPLLTPLMRFFRTPVKFFQIASLALCLLAASGVHQAGRAARRPSWLLFAPGVLLLAFGLAAAVAPEALVRGLRVALPALAVAEATEVARMFWPAAVFTSGALALGVALVLWGTPQRAPLAAVLVAFDLAGVTAYVNTTVPADFYRLRSEVAALVEPAAALGRYRWFSYSAAESRGGLRWNPSIAARNSDVPLFAVERQALLPRTNVLDGVEAAFDEDRVGWAPEGSTIPAGERVARLHEAHQGRLRLANVRWVVSFLPLPEGLVSPRGQASLAELQVPLRLYELKDPAPRAFWVAHHEIVAPDALRARLFDPGFDPRAAALLTSAPGVGVVPEPAADRRAPAADGVPEARYQLLDAHTVQVDVDAPPGWVVVLDGHHPGWQVEEDGRPVPLLRGYGRYRVFPTAGGRRVFLLRYRPWWRGPALAGSLLGAVLAAALAWRRREGPRASEPPPPPRPPPP